MTDCATDERIASRIADSCWTIKWDGDMVYPAPVPLYGNPKSGDTAHRILEWNWLLVKSVNSPSAWEAAKRNNGGWINWAQNKEWGQGEVLSDKPEPMPVVEGITSIGAKHIVIETRNGSARIDCYHPKEIIPDWHTPETHPHKWVHFRAIDKHGNLSNSPNGEEFYFPIFGDSISGECWIPLEKAWLRDGEPTWSDLPATVLAAHEPSAIGELKGIGWFIYILDRREYDIAAWVQMATEANVTHVLIRAANGIYAYNQALMQEAVDGFRAAGIQVWGWHYIYPFYKRLDGTRYSASTQAMLLDAQIERAVNEIKLFSFDGWVVNAEKEWKYTSAAIPAKAHMKALHADINVPLVISTYRYPSLHRPFPFEAFLEYADINMPQVYWMFNDNPAEQLRKSIREYGELVIQRPIFPTGAAFGEHGWRAKPDEVTEFLAEVERLGLPGCNFWEFWDAAYRGNGTLWDTVSDYNWGVNEDIVTSVQLGHAEAKPDQFYLPKIGLAAAWRIYIDWLQARRQK